MEYQSAFQKAGSLVKVNSFLRSVYNWMAIGLLLTAVTAFFVASTPALHQVIYGNPMVLFGMIIGELVLVFTLASRVQKLKASTATTMFVVYAVLNGAVLSSIFLVYTSASIVSTFFVCAMTFGAFSVYGMVTKRDLTSVGSFAFMGLIGIIIASVVNMFIQSNMMTMLISYIGVIVFVGLTAYDTQKLKEMAINQPADASGAMIRKGSIMGALSLYLDFINLFIMLLHIMGVARD